jgi:hypothetical protein
MSEHNLDTEKEDEEVDEAEEEEGNDELGVGKLIDELD